MAMSPAQWLREAALTRRLPSPPVSEINRGAICRARPSCGQSEPADSLGERGRPRHGGHGLTHQAPNRGRPPAPGVNRRCRRKRYPVIAKAVKGRGFRGALAYDLGKDEGRILDTNLSGSNLRELSAEFGAIRKLRPNLERAVLHVSLSAAPGEKLSDAQWSAIARRYLEGNGAERQPIRRHPPHRHRVRAHPHPGQPHYSRRARSSATPRTTSGKKFSCARSSATSGCSSSRPAGSPSGGRRPGVRSKSRSVPRTSPPACGCSSWPTPRWRGRAPTPSTGTTLRSPASSSCLCFSRRAPSSPA